MSKEEIDELFKLIKNEDVETILEKYGGSYKSIPIEEIDGDISDEIFKNIMQRIEQDQGAYKYFTTKRDNKETIEIYIDFMGASSKKEGFKEFAEEYLTSKNKFKLGSSYIIKLIKATGNIEEYLKKETLNELGIINDYNITSLIEATENVEKYLTPEKLIEFGIIDCYSITSLIEATENIEKYLFKGQGKYDIKDFRLNMGNIIKGTGKIEEYLTPEKLKKLNLLEDRAIITKLIKATEDIDKYLFEGQDKNDENLRLNMSNIIKGTGKIEEYLTPKKVRELDLDRYTITELIKATRNIDKYLFKGQGKYDIENFRLNMGNIIKGTGKIEEYLTPEKLIEFGLNNNYYITELIKATENIEKYLFEGQDKNDENLRLNMGNVIKGTGKEIEEYLTPEKINELDFDRGTITDLIIATEKIEEYLTPEKLKKLGLLEYGDYIVNLIIATRKIEKYLTEKLKKLSELGLNHPYYITKLIKATGNIEKYLFEGQDKNDENLSLNISNIIKGTGKIEEYLTLDNIRDFKLDNDTITELIKATENVDKYLLDGQDKEDKDLSFNIWNVINAFVDPPTLKVIEDLMTKNDKLLETLLGNFLPIIQNNTYNLNEEQLLRITNYKDVQEFLVSIAENETMRTAVNYLINNDDNWIISLNRIIDNKEIYKDLIANLNDKDIKNNDEKFMTQLICVLSDTDNYFDINDENDISGYFDKKINICNKILEKTKREEEIPEEEIPENLKKQGYNKEDLYKFALLEYKLGISLEETRRLVERYATDIEKIDEIVKANEDLNKRYFTASKYFYILKEILECENIEGLISKAVTEGTLGGPLDVSVDSRNIESQMLNLFAEIYNETLYQPKEGDKSQQPEEYIDKNGRKYDIPVYNLTDDFNINIRVEGAYSNFVEPNNFEDYYNQPNITDHGNCESYIGNDSISGARNESGVAVGYSKIRENCLIGSAPYDIWSSNQNFSIFNEANEGYDTKSQFLLPKSMKDNTRHTHNEMIKERIIIDENRNVVKYKPDYAIWIEETPIQYRDEKWQEEKEKNSQWIMTKKLAAQLGIPIIVIDREYYAQREEKKVEILKDLILGKKINLTEEEKKTYNKFIEENEVLSKPELIKELFTKYENNRVGLQHNEDLRETYFTQGSLEGIVKEIQEYIEKKLSDEGKKKECLQAMMEVAFKEKNAVEIIGEDGSKLKEMKEKMKAFYTDLTNQCQKKLLEIEQQEQSKQQTQKSESKTTTSGEPQNYIDYKKIISGISKTNFYEGNEQHSIEHIQKVILFSELLARGEGITEEDKKLLLVAAAYHDSGRQGLGDGNVSHAVQSAEKTGKILRGKQKELIFGITDKKDIAMIQTAIEYHECKDKTAGKVDEDTIKEIAMNYAKENKVDQLDQLDIERVIKICEILKDADALDRYRFAENGTLNPKFLRTKTAKNANVQVYAKYINEMVARQILEQICEVDSKKIENGRAVESLKGEYAITYDRKRLAKYEIYDTELAERCGIDDIRKIYEIENGKAKVYEQLVQARSENIRAGFRHKEEHLDFTEIYSTPFPEIQKEENKSEVLLQFLGLWSNDRITHQELNGSLIECKETMQQIEQGENTIEEQSDQRS